MIIFETKFYSNLMTKIRFYMHTIFGNPARWKNRIWLSLTYLVKGQFSPTLYKNRERREKENIRRENGERKNKEMGDKGKMGVVQNKRDPIAY